MKYIVTTTINGPTEAIEGLSKLPGWERIVIGDKKTPSPWVAPNTRYIGPGDQEKLSHSLIALLPWNLPARAMIGFLEAMAGGAESITQVDDDNIPNEHFAIPDAQGTYAQVSGSRFENVYQHYTDAFIWPRGFPLDRILSAKPSNTKATATSVGVWQHLADSDTDVDAIYRLTRNSVVTFKQNPPVSLASGTACPFNCQSTTFYREFFPLLYLPVTVHPRVSDIMRGYVAQPILWKYGHTLGFTAPTVRQDRNPHNYLKDFEGELDIYIHAERILDIVEKSVSGGTCIYVDIKNAYTALGESGLVRAEELQVLAAWCNDVKRLSTTL